MTSKISLKYYSEDDILYCYLNDNFIFNSRRHYLGEDFDRVTRMRVSTLENAIFALSKPNKKGEMYRIYIEINHEQWVPTQVKLDGVIIELLERIRK